MLRAGWNALKLNAPGKFLVSAPEHDTPRRARAYLVTDEMVTETAAWNSQVPRQLDAISRNAMLNASAFPALLPPSYSGRGSCHFRIPIFLLVVSLAYSRCSCLPCYGGRCARGREQGAKPLEHVYPVRVGGSVMTCGAS